MIRTTTIWVLVLLVWGCSDFLEESSQDEVRPSTVSDLEQLLLGDGYESDYDIYYATEIFTDNIESYGVFATEYQEEHDRGKWKYTWNESMFTEAYGGYDATFWQAPYEGILGCNLVLDNLEKVSGNDHARAYLRGEALTLRAWYYLHLVNFFGIAYNQGNPETDLGVPLKVQSAVTGEFYPRNTVAEVYARIEEDLSEGSRLLKEHDQNRNYFRMDHLAAKAIMSRMYLYMEDWDRALAYADSVLVEKGGLLDLNTVDWKQPIYFLGGMYVFSVYSASTPDEIIWGRDGVYEYNMGWGLPPYPVSEGLLDSYGASVTQVVADAVSDIRAKAYIGWDMNLLGTVYPNEISRFSSGLGRIQGIRTAELYLNRAEASAQKYLKEGNDTYRVAALEDLNKLRRARYNKAYAYEEVDIRDGQELLEFCIEERRRELCGETNHRWCDLRRYGMTVNHVLMEDGAREFTNEMGHYVLPIPKQVLDKNPALVQN